MQAQELTPTDYEEGLNRHIDGLRHELEEPEALPQGYAYASQLGIGKLLPSWNSLDDNVRSRCINPIIPIGLALRVEEKEGELFPYRGDNEEMDLISIGVRNTSITVLPTVSDSSFNYPGSNSHRQSYHNGVQELLTGLGISYKDIKSQQVYLSDRLRTGVEELTIGEMDRSRSFFRRIGSAAATYLFGGDKFIPQPIDNLNRLRFAANRWGLLLRLGTAAVGLSSLAFSAAAGDPVVRAEREAKAIAYKAGELTAGSVGSSFGLEDHGPGKVVVNPSMERIGSIDTDISGIISMIESRADGVASNLEYDIQEEAIAIGLGELFERLAPIAAASLIFRRRKNEITQYEESETVDALYVREEIPALLSRERALQLSSIALISISMLFCSSIFHYERDNLSGRIEEIASNKGSEIAENSGKEYISSSIDSIIGDLPVEFRQGLVESLNEYLQDENSEKVASVIIRVILDAAKNPDNFEGIDSATLLATLDEMGVKMDGITVDGGLIADISNIGEDDLSDLNLMREEIRKIFKDEVAASLDENISISDKERSEHVSELARSIAMILGISAIAANALIIMSEKKD